MKKFMIFILVLIVLLVGVVVLLPKFVPLEKVKTAMQAQVKEQIGRDLKIDGAIKISVWPSISVNLKQVSLSNADWAKTESLISLDEVDIELQLMPLLKKHIEIERFILHRPQISLEVNKAGKGNWEFDNLTASKEEESTTSTEKTSIPDGLNLKLGEFKIIDGVVNYEDNKENVKYALDKINITIDAKGIDSPISLKGEAQYRARMVKVEFSSDKLSSLISMSPFKGKLSLNIDPFANFSMAGDFLENSETYMTVDMNTNITDIPALINWVSPTGAGNIPFKTLTLKSPKIVAGTRINGLAYATISGMQISLDDLNMSGILNFQSKPNATPNINAGLEFTEALDIPALIKKLSTPETKESTKTAPATTSAGWSDEIIDLSALHSVNGKFTLDHQGLIYKGLKTGAGKARVKLNNGTLTFDLPETSVDKGKLKSNIILQESGHNTKLNINMQATNMPIKLLLNTFADINMLSGTGNVDFSAASVGQSQKSIVANLNGTGALNLADGEIEGINFVNIAQMMQKRLSNVGLGDGGTKFTDFNASFNIVNGIISNKDMKLVGPLVEAVGTGEANLPNQTMNYRVTPQVVLKKATATDATTGTSTTTTTGLAIPVDIKGAWSNLKIKPDYKSLINNVLKDPEQLKQMGRDLEDNVKEQIDVIKTIKKNPKDLLKDPEAAEKLLKGIFGR